MNRLRPFATGLFPEPPSKPVYPGEIYAVTTRAWGSHQKGDYVMAYHPDRAMPQRPTVVIYLHGFTFCNPFFYDAHMRHLAKQGAFVFFVDYQIDSFQDTQTPEPPDSDLDTIEAFVKAALDSFTTTGEAMIRTAWATVKTAMEATHLSADACDIVLFGHSVGGLFALSWPYFNGPEGIQAIFAADPIPATASLPSFLMDAARKENARTSDIDLSLFPFLAQPVKASETGKGLSDIPIAILVGNSDKFVKISDWTQLWPDLATVHKRLYISQTDTYYGIYRCDAQRALTAYHNQSVTNTLLYGPEDLQSLLGGAGIENDLRWRCVWAGLDAILQGARADQLTFDMGRWSNGKPVRRVKAWPLAPKRTTRQVGVIPG
ncbi:MAG: hypothetical protein RLZZ117_1688 [Cyanobacteriota bacterium]